MESAIAATVRDVLIEKAPANAGRTGKLRCYSLLSELGYGDRALLRDVLEKAVGCELPAAALARASTLVDVTVIVDRAVSAAAPPPRLSAEAVDRLTQLEAPAALRQLIAAESALLGAGGRPAAHRLVVVSGGKTRVYVVGSADLALVRELGERAGAVAERAAATRRIARKLPH